MSADTLNLPIIDLSELDNESTRADFYKKLRAHARNYGFFYLVGHGIDPNDREKMLNAAKKFFALPLEEKEKISMDNSPHFRGYTKNGNENTRQKKDYREVLDIGEELPVIRVPEEEKDRIQYNMSGPNQWPAAVPELETTSMHWFHTVKQLTIKLLRAFMVALELPEDALDELLVGTPIDLLKICHYPANTGEDGEGQAQGLGPHKDTGLLTMLWQDETGGLQVFTEENGWIDAVPVKNSFYRQYW
ncbi:non-haem dioxygenase in morphine synthesis N-terminal/2OG-Fe(II) oxygenase superfamily, putative [Angomonas deanei]|uniref:Non-haem dioxygenase in morphine synthesis N-terminal/2OG-Fe(II) oxygenase superfamily, putative n=1 Tax=Angomonas deanei TaxID=59799 RepID=A0A7G2CSU0_9TRYP|nr:non-haem dioxygenase in morphine synthesis N-terminal/2OG-Fe(II) oxygenase superfamily, putative [Angomonas deanei]